MKFLSFTVSNYRAIRGPLTLDVSKRSLVPVIGINESGKTTILQALFAWDYNNDSFNTTVHHLDDVSNLYDAKPPASTVSAVIELDKDKLISILRTFQQQETHKRSASYYLRSRNSFPPTLQVTRNLVTKKYSIEHAMFKRPVFNSFLASEIVRHCPFVLYFDDFRDSVEDVIEIVPEESKSISAWLEIVDQLFSRTDPTFSVYDLPKMEDRRRKTVLAKVKRRLNETLTSEWQTFRLEDSEALRISLEYFEEEESAVNSVTQKAESITRSYLKFEVIETNEKGDEHFFFIKDRSKGFFWFFNFVMKLEFNPKVMSDDDTNTIYLLDEPGSYLHAAAQRRLCAKLKSLSARNKVIYCTHSHYLLDPEVIPIASLHVAGRDGSGSIDLVPFHQYPATTSDHKLAFQPLLDALHVRPFVLDMSMRKVVIVEGATDFYSYDIFKPDETWGVLPARNADSVGYLIGLMLAWRVQFVALWDNDAAGRQAHERIVKEFGPEFEAKHLRLLPSKSGNPKRILQDLFEGSDIEMIKSAIGLPSNASFGRVVMNLYYWDNRKEVIARIGDRTRRNFAEVFEALPLKQL